MSAQMPQAGSGTTGKPGRAGTNQCTFQVANTVALNPLDLFEVMKVGLLPELFAIGHPLLRCQMTPMSTKNYWSVFCFLNLHPLELKTKGFPKQCRSSLALCDGIGSSQTHLGQG